VKTIFLILTLSALSVAAQVPPPPEQPATETPAPAARREDAVRAAPTNAMLAGTNASAVPVPTPAPNTAPVAPATATPAPGVSFASPKKSAKPAMAGEPIIPAGQINFVAADLNNVLGIYAELVGRTILRPANLAAPQIVLKTQTPLTKSEAIQALDAVLALNGIAMLNVGDKFVKAVPVAQANQEAKEIDDRPAEELPDFGSYVTHVVQLKYAKPSEIQPVLQQFAKIPNSIFPIDSSMILILRDYTENVKRMLEMIDKVDVTIPSEFVSEVIPIKYALASDIASALSSLGGGGTGTSVGRSQRSGAGGAGGGAARPGQTGYGGVGGLGGNPQGVNTPGAGGVGTPSAGGSFSDRLQNIIRRASSAQGDLQILGTTKIIADERMNALLIFASRSDMDTITNIVAKLDVVLAQVLIETIIMDVSMDNLFQFGVSAGETPQANGNWQRGGVYNNPSGSGGSTPLNTLNQFFNNSAAATNLTSIFPGTSGFNYFGRYNGDYDVAVTALSSDSRVNVIQKPRIQTSHATPASIFIGETVPYISSTYYGGGYAGGPSSSYQQLKVGIGLNVTPFINPEGLVVMKIDETIDEISGSVTIDNNPVPSTTSRTISAEVAVRDKETIILGGFIRNSDHKEKNGVPFLKDIPLLGYLFRSTSDEKIRKELIVLMRPTVLRTPEMAAAHVSVEKERLPGVRRAEMDLDVYERKAARGMKKEGFDKPTPFTEEEIKLYGKPEDSSK